MDDNKILIVFLKWLRENPNKILGQAWRNLPALRDKIQTLNTVSEVAKSIRDWCIDNKLGKELVDACKRKEIDPTLPDGIDSSELKNYIPTFPQEITNAIQRLEAQSLANNNPSSVSANKEQPQKKGGFLQQIRNFLSN